MKIRLILLGIGTMLLTACGSSTATPASISVKPTEQSTAAPVATSRPSVTSAAPSPTPEPTPIPVSDSAHRAQVTTLVEELNSATGGIAVDLEGLIYVADIGRAPSRLGSTIYKITPEGEVTVFFEGGGLRGASGNAVGPDGNLYQSSLKSSEIYRITPDGEATVYAEAGISGPVGLAFDHEGNLYVANCAGNTVQQIGADGSSTEVAGGHPLNCPNGIALDGEGNIYIANFGDGWVISITPSGEMQRLAELPGSNNAHLVFHSGRLIVVDRGGHRIYEVTLDGEIALLAGGEGRGVDDGPALSATFSLPNGIAISPDGTKVYINQVTHTVGTTVNNPIAVRVIDLGQED